MNTIGQVKTGWKKMDNALNQVIAHLNQRTLIQGDGISISEGPAGAIIGLRAAPQKPAEGLKDEGSTAGWHQLTVIDTKDCSHKYIWYWGTAATANQKAPPPNTHPISSSK